MSAAAPLPAEGGHMIIDLDEVDDTVQALTELADRTTGYIYGNDVAVLRTAAESLSSLVAWVAYLQEAMWDL